jgi:hypothetical protein
MEIKDNVGKKERVGKERRRRKEEEIEDGVKRELSLKCHLYVKHIHLMFE